ncbi:hypothetical protein SB748_29400 [Rhizobium sp. SIMBA_035]
MPQGLRTILRRLLISAHLLDNRSFARSAMETVLCEESSSKLIAMLLIFDGVG